MGLQSKVGFVGLGQCGGNIASLFEQNGYDCLFINSSQKDLQTINGRYKYHIPNAEGCSKDRNKAIEYAKEYYSEIAQQIVDKLSDKTIIYLCTSTGGGTGSGLTPILAEIVSATVIDKAVGVICAIPSVYETIQTQINTIYFFQEIADVNGLGCIFIIDNDKTNKFKSNSIFFSTFSTMINIPNYISTNGNFDESEIWKLLKTNGVCVIGVSKDTITKPIESQIIKSWEDNIFADIEGNKQIKYLGISSGEGINIEHLERYIGKPIDTYQGYNSNEIITILSGLSLPYKRLEKINNIIVSNKESIKVNQNSRLEFKINADWMKELKFEVNNNNKDKTDIEGSLQNIFKKYGE